MKENTCEKAIACDTCGKSLVCFHVVNCNETSVRSPVVLEPLRFMKHECPFNRSSRTLNVHERTHTVTVMEIMCVIMSAQST